MYLAILIPIHGTRMGEMCVHMLRRPTNDLCAAEIRCIVTLFRAGAELLDLGKRKYENVGIIRWRFSERTQ